MSTLREAAIGAMGALETARNGLAWYRDRYPESTDGSDDEAAGDIDAAIDALRAELAKPDARPAPAEPQPAAQQEQAGERKPLTDEQVFASEDFMSANGLYWGLPMTTLIQIVRCTERAHGITATKGER